MTTINWRRVLRVVATVLAIWAMVILLLFLVGSVNSTHS
jgi:hypothetical protein